MTSPLKQNTEEDGANHHHGHHAHGHHHHGRHYRAYRERWLFLANAAVINAALFMMLYALDVVATYSAEYYGVDGDTLDLVNIAAWIIYIFGLWIGIYCIERFELLVSVRASVTVCAVGCLVRMLSTFPPYNEHIPKELQFWLTFAGQLLISFFHPVIMTMSTKVSQTWFPEQERPISTALLGLASLIGGLFAQAAVPAIVRKDSQNVPYINIYISISVFLGLVVSWTLIRRAKPPTPPSHSSEILLEREGHLPMSQILKDVRSMLSSKTCLVYGVTMGLGVGMTSTLMTQLNQLMCSREYTTSQSSLGAMVAVLAGLAGAFTMGPLAKKLGRQREFGVGGFCLACVAAIAFVVALGYPDQFSFIAVSLAFYGFFGIAAFPINLEIMLEHTFPIDAVIGECWIHTWGQAFNVALVVAGNNFYNPMPDSYQGTCGNEVDPRDYTPYYYVVMAVATASALSLTLVAHPKMKRMQKDHEDDDKDSDSSSDGGRNPPT